MTPARYAACLCVFQAALAVSPAPAQTPTVQTTQTTQNSTQPEYTIRTRVPITILDVIVTDRDGHPVHDLTEADFTILEDNQEVAAKSFEEHRTDTLPATPLAPPPPLPANTFTNVIPATPDRPINILLLDSSNAPMQVQQIVQQQMLAYVARMPPGAQFAVFSLTTHLTILQGFTTDPGLVRAAITGKKNIAQLSALEDFGQDPMNGEVTDGPRWVQVEHEGQAAAMRAQYTFAALAQIARFLSGVPGRKNLIWFGGSFPTQYPPVADSYLFPPPGSPPNANGGAPPPVYDVDTDLKAVIEQLARARVALYPIDGRGVENILPENKSATKLSAHGAMILGEQDTMLTLAERTGGKAFYNTNGLTEAVEKAVDLGANFYTLIYTPTNQNLDTRFRNIKVRVNRPGLHLIYRNGYYANPPEVSTTGRKLLPQPTPMEAAMLRGAPAPSQVRFQVSVALKPTPPPRASPGYLPNGFAPPATKDTRPTYRRYTLAYTLTAADLAFATTADGSRTAHFQFAVLVYNAADGNLANSTATEVHAVFNTANYKAALLNGLTGDLDADVPTKGDFVLRIGIRDFTSNRVGVIEVPLAALRPGPAQTASP
jgi:VWFA-related protein